MMKEVVVQIEEIEIGQIEEIGTEKEEEGRAQGIELNGADAPGHILGLGHPEDVRCHPISQ